MIEKYIRPDTLEEILSILQHDASSRPLAGGTTLVNSPEIFNVVDLQNSGLDYIKRSKDTVQIGAMTTLESIRSALTDFPAIYEAINIEASRNIREQATLGGTIISGNGRSPLLTVLLGMDAELVWLPGSTKIHLGDWLAQKNHWGGGVLLSEILLDSKCRCKFEFVGRSPLDIPMISTALTLWHTGRMRLVVGGYGEVPTLVLDGSVTDDIKIALKSALSESTDEWASAEYRTHAATVIASRSLQVMQAAEVLK